MIQNNQLFEDIKSLPPEKQAEVIDLVERLKSKQSNENESPKSRRSFGSMKGLVVYMADDFDEPLEDFSEYMY